MVTVTFMSQMRAGGLSIAIARSTERADLLSPRRLALQLVWPWTLSATSMSLTPAAEIFTSSKPPTVQRLLSPQESVTQPASLLTVAEIFLSPIFLATSFIRLPQMELR